MMQTQLATIGTDLGAVLPAWRAMAGSRPLAGLTVLVVEDSRYASEAVRLLCLRSGARIRRANCIASAQRHLSAYRPAVVIVDMGLPDGDGADLIAQLATLRPRVPVILGVSGDPDNRAAALGAGAQGFFAKPVESLAVFQQVILEALPPESRALGLRALPTEVVLPDIGALRDDLAHVLAVLRDEPAPEEVVFIARFVDGLARAARDSRLALQARKVIDAGEAATTDAVTQLQMLVEQRLREVEGI